MSLATLGLLTRSFSPRWADSALSQATTWRTSYFVSGQNQHQRGW